MANSTLQRAPFAKCLLGILVAWGLVQHSAAAQSAVASWTLSADSIEAALATSIESHDGDVAVHVMVLDNDNRPKATWGYQSDKVMPTASLIKLPVLMELYRQAATKELSLDDQVTLRQEDKVPGSGILTEHFSAGAQLALRDAARLMIRYSDNTATNLVLDAIGLPSTGKTMAELGFPETQIHAKVYRRDTSIALERSKAYGLGSTTASDMVALLVQLERGTFVSQEVCHEILEHLMQCDDTSKMPKLLPTGVTVAHKTGAVTRVRTDSGIIYHPSAKIVLAILTNDNADTSWAESNEANRLCARIARDVYDLVDRQIAQTDDAVKSPRELAVGAHGELVEALQRTLNDRIGSNLSVDGDFGPATLAAVKAFQSTQQIDVTGFVDSETWRMLGKLLSEELPVPPPEQVNAAKLSRSPPLNSDSPPSVSAKAWAILDSAEGRIVAEMNSDAELDIASTTKLMTAYVVLSLAEENPSVLEQTVTFSQRADRTPGSTAGVRAGEQLTVDELLYGLLLPSGNDAAVALAEHFGEQLVRPVRDSSIGNSSNESELDAYTAFVNAMNRRALDLGLKHTKFRNPHGLTESGHFSSAADLARLAWFACKMSGLRRYVGTRQHGCRLTSQAGYTRDVVWKNTNRLLSQEGFAGMKTGTTSAAGACLISLGTQGDRETIVVVLGASSSDSRYIDARNLFRWTWRAD